MIQLWNDYQPFTDKTMTLDFIGRDHYRGRPVFKTETEQIIFEGVRAAFHGEGFAIAAVIWGRTQNDDIYLLDSWEASLTDNDFNVKRKVEEWAKEYGLSQVALARISDIPESSNHYQHPLTSEMSAVSSVGCYVATFAPYKGLVKHQSLLEDGKLKTQYFRDYNRIIEKIRRLDPKAKEADAIVLAFLLGMCEHRGRGFFSVSPASVIY